MTLPRLPRAVLLDLDGTLYRQAPLRAAMLIELATLAWRHERAPRIPRVWRALRAFRRVREDLRMLGHADVPLVDLQYTAAAQAAGCDESWLRTAVDEWMFRRPLKYLPRLRRRGVAEALAGCRARGLQVGVFSDYPTADKLRVLGLADLVTLEVCATDPHVNAFKPHPRGFLAAAARWGLDPADVVYVGDRPEVDAAGAAAAGMRCLIVAGRAGGTGGFDPMPSFEELDRALALSWRRAADLAVHPS